MSAAIEEERIEAPLRLSFLLPALGALCYPFLLSLVSFLLKQSGVAVPPSPGVIAISVLAILAVVGAVLAMAFTQALALARSDPTNSPARTLAHLAFATPSLFTAFGNVTGLLHARGATLYAWVIFWLVMMLIAMLAREPARPLASEAAARRNLAAAHGICALIILLMFILPHLADHLAGIISGSAHIDVMNALRNVYRSQVGEPILLALICFQIVSGLLLVQRKLVRPSDVFGTLQTLTGIYVGIYLLGHMTAAFSARGAGTDTNWNWLTGNDHGLLYHLSGFSLVGHYWVGPIAIVTHVACGLRGVMLQHGVSDGLASRTAWLSSSLGIIASSVILAGLLGAHVA